MYKTIFFDLDDTLLDTVSNTITTLKEIYVQYRLEVYFDSFDDFFENYFHPNNMNLWAKYERGEIDKQTLLRERFTVPFQHIDAVSEKEALSINDDYLQRIATKKKLVDGAIELLKYLKPKYNLHIISNGFTELQYDKMASAGLDGYFDKIILSDKVGINKPHPDIFKYALTQTGAKIEESIMIGDNYLTDIMGAYGAGINQIWYNVRNTKPNSENPTYIIKHLLEVKNIL